MNLSAVLLAGGESLRMGRDKATMLFRDRPLWKHQLELLRELEPEEIFVSARFDPSWRPAAVEFVADAQPSRGPMSGIAAGLSRIRTNHLLVLAIDVPFMSASYLRELRRRVGPGRGVVPLIGSCTEPLAAIYPRAAEIDFRKAISGNDFSLQRLVAGLVAAGKLEAVRVLEKERGLFRNLNEPSDLDGG